MVWHKNWHSTIHNPIAILAQSTVSKLHPYGNRTRMGSCHGISAMVKNSTHHVSQNYQCEGCWQLLSCIWNIKGPISCSLTLEMHFWYRGLHWDCAGIAIRQMESASLQSTTLAQSWCNPGHQKLETYCSRSRYSHPNHSFEDTKMQQSFRNPKSICNSGAIRATERGTLWYWNKRDGRPYYF